VLLEQPLHSVLDGDGAEGINYGATGRCVGSVAKLVTDQLIASDAFERLRQMTASRPVELVEICREFLTEARQTLAQLRNAFTLKQAEELRNRAHYLKGSSLIVGAIGVTRCCASLEAMGKNGNLSEAEAILDQLSAELQAVEQEYLKLLGPGVLPGKGPAA
jgi:HPt (histidine-containing phosphotransfer) domain-containing protein